VLCCAVLCCAVLCCAVLCCGWLLQRGDRFQMCVVRCLVCVLCACVSVCVCLCVCLVSSPKRSKHTFARSVTADFAVKNHMVHTHSDSQATDSLENRQVSGHDRMNLGDTHGSPHLHLPTRGISFIQGVTASRITAQRHWHSLTLLGTPSISSFVCPLN
jgi:hypothetical protein